MTNAPPATSPSAWPGREAWRRGHKRRAVCHAIVALGPSALALALATRSLERLQTPRFDEIVAALVLVALVPLGWFSARLDASSLLRSGLPTSGWSRAQHLLTNSPASLAGALFVLGFTLVALLAPLLAPHDPFSFTKIELQPPTSAHWLGTDEIGRDLLSRLLYGARVSLAVGLVTVALAIGLGTLVGLLAGYLGGRLDSTLMRLVDLLLAFPRIFLVLLVIALWGPSIWLVIAVLGLTGWMTTARLVRAQVLNLREVEYVQAARVTGASTWRVLLAHVLPNAMAPVLVSASLMVGNTILAESTLSFLGLGVQVPTPSWGAMLNEARASWRVAWWLATFPGAAITVVVVAYNLLGDGLRDVLDPRADGRQET